MAAPDIVNVTSILGKTAYDTDISNVASAILTNAASSNKVLKVNTLIIANIDGAASADITISVPGDSTLVVISKDTSIYLEEDRAIFLTASAAGDLSGTISYEELDDA